jgi:hypothetical protein
LADDVIYTTIFYILIKINIGFSPFIIFFQIPFCLKLDRELRSRAHALEGDRRPKPEPDAGQRPQPVGGGVRPHEV